MGGDSRFASRLRWWRQRRGMSQLALAHEAEISQRHVSFLESGRTAPSREMVLRLAAALDLPFREQNALLLAAGFAPAWRETPLGTPELALVDRALDYMLMQQEPYPAFVVDRRWQLLRANLAGRSLVRFLTDSPAWKPDPSQLINLADALVAPDALRPLIVNWREVSRCTSCAACASTRWPMVPAKLRPCSNDCSPTPTFPAYRTFPPWRTRRSRSSPCIFVNPRRHSICSRPSPRWARRGT
jgi:transcriptional regulator with XRE-family HTH domain